MSTSDRVDLLKIVPRELREMLRLYLLYDEIDVSFGESRLQYLFLRGKIVKLGFALVQKLAFILDGIHQYGSYREKDRLNLDFFNYGNMAIFDHIDDKFTITILSPLSQEIKRNYSPIDWFSKKALTEIEPQQKIVEKLILNKAESIILLLKLERLYETIEERIRATVSYENDFDLGHKPVAFNDTFVWSDNFQ